MSPRKKCIQAAQTTYNQATANIQANHVTNLKEGALAGFVTGVIGNCISGAVVGAAVPIATGVFAFTAPVTGLAGCAANALNPVGLIAGVGGGLAGAYGLDIYHAQVAKNDYNNQVNACSALPD
jgi:hypothetical protein